jgi:hypothetical protein
LHCPDKKAYPEKAVGYPLLCLCNDDCVPARTMENHPCQEWVLTGVMTILTDSCSISGYHYETNNLPIYTKE